MLRGSFFTTQDTASTSSAILTAIDLNVNHEIFEGHFPGQPVLPGVCMMQIVKELLEHECGSRLQLKKADNLKFLAVIDPTVTPRFMADLQYNKVDETITVSGKFYQDAITFLKFRCSYVYIDQQNTSLS